VSSEQEERAIGYNISLYPSEWAVARLMGGMSGQRTRTAGVRAVIAELLRLRPDLVELVEAHLDENVSDGGS